MTNEIDPMEVVQCVKAFNHLSIDKIMTLKAAITFQEELLDYNGQVMVRALNEVIKSRLNTTTLVFKI